jgi:hypothetical protein
VIGPCRGLTGEMLAGTEADLELEGAIMAEQGPRIERTGCRHFYGGQQFLDQGRLALAQFMSLAPAVQAPDSRRIVHRATA